MQYKNNADLRIIFFFFMADHPHKQEIEVMDKVMLTM